MSVSTEQALKLADGNLMPLLGLGVWQVENSRQCVDAVRWALELGYRHIDTAQAYGNEDAVGQGLRESGVSREDMFITTKFFPRNADPAAELEASLERLGVDYVDLYIVHWPAEGAAHAIYGRVRASVGDLLTPETLNAVSDGRLREAGLSRNKVAYLRDLSAKVLDGTVVLTRTSRRSDDELIERLTSVHGIGRWTADVYLMFQLRRLDIWPVDDLGIRRGYGLAWNIDPAPTAKELEALGERFRPYRTIVAWYCWAAVSLSGPTAR